MNSVLILVFNILASSQAKPDAATNMVIEHAKISMPADSSGGGDYASGGNKDTNVNINRASIVMPESSGGLTFSTFSTFSTFYNILLQISGATCISDAVILAERFTPVTLAMFLLQEVEEETMLLRAIKTPTSTSKKPKSKWRQVVSHGILGHRI